MRSYDVFISYRRRTGIHQANLIKSELSKENYTCFLDTDNLLSGDYRKELEPSVQACKALLILITENHIEEYAKPGDACLLELQAALKYNKDIIVLSYIPRKDVRDKLNTIENLPECVRHLVNQNILYIDPNIVKNDTITKVIASIREINKKLYNKISSKLSKDLRIQIDDVGEVSFTYEGPCIDNYLIGHGFMVDSCDEYGIRIEGEFSCPNYNICGDLSIYKHDEKFFAGHLDKIKSIHPLKISGYGVLTTNEFNYEGLINDGLFEGYGILINKQLDYQYRGFFRDGKKRGCGILKKDGIILKSIFYSNIPSYGTSILLEKYNALIFPEIDRSGNIDTKVDIAFTDESLGDIRCNLKFEDNYIQSINIAVQKSKNVECTIKEDDICEMIINNVSSIVTKVVITKSDMDKINIIITLADKYERLSCTISTTTFDFDLDKSKNVITKEGIEEIVVKYKNYSNIISKAILIKNELLEFLKIFKNK